MRNVWFVHGRCCSLRLVSMRASNCQEQYQWSGLRFAIEVGMWTESQRAQIIFVMCARSGCDCCSAVPFACPAPEGCSVASAGLGVHQLARFTQCDSKIQEQLEKV
jgi:hypothetical protein